MDDLVLNVRLPFTLCIQFVVGIWKRFVAFFLLSILVKGTV